MLIRTHVAGTGDDLSRCEALFTHEVYGVDPLTEEGCRSRPVCPVLEDPLNSPIGPISLRDIPWERLWLTIGRIEDLPPISN
jgi:hypothetical protein